jgi:hypothetical protein
MQRKFSFYCWLFNTEIVLFSYLCREYADEAIKQGKVFGEAAKEKLEVVANEAMKSKFLRENEIMSKTNIIFVHS